MDTCAARARLPLWALAIDPVDQVVHCRRKLRTALALLMRKRHRKTFTEARVTASHHLHKSRERWSARRRQGARRR
jgi:hypothetical protein